jgi:hypothetical protein
LTLTFSTYTCVCLCCVDSRPVHTQVHITCLTILASSSTFSCHIFSPSEKQRKN